MQVLKQGRKAPVPVEKQVAILYAAVHEILAAVEPCDIGEYEEGLYLYLDTNPAGAAAMEAIRSTGNLDADTEEKLKNALEEYTGRFLKGR